MYVLYTKGTLLVGRRIAKMISEGEEITKRFSLFQVEYDTWSDDYLLQVKKYNWKSKKWEYVGVSIPVEYVSPIESDVVYPIMEKVTAHLLQAKASSAKKIRIAFAISLAIFLVAVLLGVLLTVR